MWSTESFDGCMDVQPVMDGTAASLDSFWEEPDARAPVAERPIPLEAVVSTRANTRDGNVQIRQEMSLQFRSKQPLETPLAFGEPQFNILEMVRNINCVSRVSRSRLLRCDWVSVGPSRASMKVENREKQQYYMVTVAVARGGPDGALECPQCGLVWDWIEPCGCDPTATTPSVEPAACHMRIGAKRWCHQRQDEEHCADFTVHFQVNPGSVRPGPVYIITLLEVFGQGDEYQCVLPEPTLIMLTAK